MAGIQPVGSVVPVEIIQRCAWVLVCDRKRFRFLCISLRSRCAAVDFRAESEQRERLLRYRAVRPPASRAVPLLGDDVLNRTAEINLETLLSGELKTMTVQTELMQQRRVNVGHIMPMLNRVKPDLISRAVHDTSL